VPAMPAEVRLPHSLRVCYEFDLEAFVVLEESSVMPKGARGWCASCPRMAIFVEAGPSMGGSFSPQPVDVILFHSVEGQVTQACVPSIVGTWNRRGLEHYVGVLELPASAACPPLERFVAKFRQQPSPASFGPTNVARAKLDVVETPRGCHPPMMAAIVP
jgi:hypothetical protein